MAGILDDRIRTYLLKAEFENCTEETKAELRFAIEALKIVKGELLFRLQSGLAVKEGWKLVPIDPTPGMTVRANKANRENGLFVASHIWAVMLAAAPEVE